MAPLKKVKKTPGRVMIRVKSPSFADDPVWAKTVQCRAVVWIQVPEKEMKCPARKNLKALFFRTCQKIFFSPLYKINF